jgi:hypothetical protein
MLRGTARWFKVFVLATALLPALVVDMRAKSGPIHDAAAVPETVTINARHGVPTSLKQAPQRKPCNAKRRALIGAAIGSIIGLVAVRKAAEANDGAAGTKTTLQAGGYGAALGVFVGLRTCP